MLDSEKAADTSAASSSKGTKVREEALPIGTCKYVKLIRDEPTRQN